AWPRIEEFSPLASSANREAAAAARATLEELVKMDLEYRWWRTAAASGNAALPGRRPEPVADALGGRPRLEDYLRQHPALGPLQDLSVELIGEEYRVRKFCGDRPSHAEYAARFSRQGPLLQQLLARIDAEVAREFG